MKRLGYIVCLATVCASLGGCGGKKKVVPGNADSRAALRTFYEALISENWPAAYAELHADEQKRLAPEQFTVLAKAYRSSIGFEPIRVQIRSCDEQGEIATAHVLLVGAQSSHQHFRDANSLRKSESRWGIVLFNGFGEPKPKAG